MKKHFNKNLVMSAEQNEEFERSNICLICGKLINLDENKIRDHCHIQFVRIHTSSLINIEKILNRPITKFYNSDDVNVIAA